MAGLVPERPASKVEDGNSVVRWGHTARLAISEWLAQCISGEVAPYFRQFAPYSRYWKIRNDTEDSDPNYPLRRDNPLERPINVNRYFENTAQSPPQFIIRDGGWTRSQTNLGGLSYGYGNQDGTTTAGIVDDVAVPVEITCGAMDSDDTSRLVHFIDAIFGPIGWPLHRGILRPSSSEQARWTVMLPLSATTVGGITDIPLAEDRQKRVWTQTVTLETRVEHVTWMTWASPIRASMLSGLQEVAIVVPDIMRIGQQVQIRMQNRPADSKLVVDDFRKALVLEGDLLLAKRTGTVVVRLISTNGGSTIFATKTVTIQP